MALYSSCLGCSAVGPWGKAGRCETCRKSQVRDYERGRAAAKARRYDAAYRRARAQWAKVLTLGPVACGRCGGPVSAASWHLDHLDDGTMRPSHPSCNVRHTSRTSV